MAIRLNGVFKDNMVLQRDKEIRIFGEVAPGSTAPVAAKIIDHDGNTIRTGETDEIYDGGFFIVSLESLPAGGPYAIDVKSGKDSVRLSGVFMGDLWLASGQSNIEYPLGRSEGAKAEMVRCPKDCIHFYNVPAAGDCDEQQRADEDATEWKVLDPKNCADVTGIGYYFAKTLRTYMKKHSRKNDVHIGIIGCYLGGTSVSCWQSAESLSRTQEGRRYLDAYDAESKGKTRASYEAELEEYGRACARYDKRLRDYLKDNPYATYLEGERVIGNFPWPPPPGPSDPRRPGALFNTMILRLVPLSLKGVIFYQGEEDCEEHSAEYGAVFKTLIEEWRVMFCEDDLPFLFCQLPMYISRDRKYMDYDDMHWPRLRKCQAETALTVPNTYMAVLTDCGEFDNIHPSDKKTPGERLAKLALHFVYGYKKVPAVAPFATNVRRGECVEIVFDGDFEQLKLLTTFDGADSGFEVAGDDNVFYKARAEIDFDGKTVILSCPQVKSPARVRYAYFSYGSAALTCDTGLAAAPFEAGIDEGISSYY